MHLKIVGRDIYATSDLHFSHENIIRFCKRPYKNIYEMNDAIIKNIHDTVPVNAILIIVGDFSFHHSSYDLYDAIKREKIFVAGNHDHEFLKKKGILFYDILDLEYRDNISFTFCHYPMVSWNKSHFGRAINVYGHHHTVDINTVFPGKRYNVSVDMNNYFPVHVEQIIEATKEMDNWDFTQYKKLDK